MSAFWIIGYAFAFGQDPGNSFIGAEYFALSNINGDRSVPSSYSDVTKAQVKVASESIHYARWFHSSALAAITCLIPAGAFAERSTMPTYLFYSFLLTGEGNYVNSYRKTD